MCIYLKSLSNYVGFSILQPARKGTSSGVVQCFSRFCTLHEKLCGAFLRKLLWVWRKIPEKSPKNKVPSAEEKNKEKYLQTKGSTTALLQVRHNVLHAIICNLISYQTLCAKNVCLLQNCCSFIFVALKDNGRLGSIFIGGSSMLVLPLPCKIF